MLAFILLIGIAYNSKLLTNIKNNEEFIIFETYSIITQKEEIKITKSQLTDIIYNSDSLFNSYNLIINYQGTNGIIKKKLYLNAEPWSELNSEISRIKKTIANHVYENMA